MAEGTSKVAVVAEMYNKGEPMTRKELVEKVQEMFLGTSKAGTQAIVSITTNFGLAVGALRYVDETKKRGGKIVKTPHMGEYELPTDDLD